MFSESPCCGSGPGLDVTFHVDTIHERDSVAEAPVHEVIDEPVSASQAYYVSGIGVTLETTADPNPDVDSVPLLREFVEHVEDGSLEKWQALGQYYFGVGESTGLCFLRKGRVRWYQQHWRKQF